MSAHMSLYLYKYGISNHLNARVANVQSFEIILKLPVPSLLPVQSGFLVPYQ